MIFSRLFFSLLVLLAANAAAAQQTQFSLKHYGHFKKMVHMKKTDGVVALDQIKLANTYGVGAPAHGTGEITIVDGKFWIDYGEDGLGNSKHKPQENEQAVILVTAQVSQWHEVVVPSDMSADQLHDFALSQAAVKNIDVKKPFPFLVEGKYYQLSWHILNGRNHAGGHGTGGIYKKITEDRSEAEGLIVGFYSAAIQGVFTHPGESWHQHVVFQKDGMAGHVDAYSVRKGSVLKLPKQ